jgi:hypothetical protein
VCYTFVSFYSIYFEFNNTLIGFTFLKWFHIVVNTEVSNTLIDFTFIYFVSLLLFFRMNLVYIFMMLNLSHLFSCRSRTLYACIHVAEFVDIISVAKIEHASVCATLSLEFFFFSTHQNTYILY